MRITVYLRISHLYIIVRCLGALSIVLAALECYISGLRGPLFSKTEAYNIFRIHGKSEKTSKRKSAVGSGLFTAKTNATKEKEFGHLGTHLVAKRSIQQHHQLWPMQLRGVWHCRSND